MSKWSDPRHANIQANQESFDAEEYEEKNVHSVYETIASHFSNTRYKPWPLIPAFLNSLPSGSVGADLGCGNGKYLSLRSALVGKKIDQQGINPGRNDILTIGLDRSSNLIDLAVHNQVIGERISSSTISTTEAHRNEVCVGDAIQSNYRSACFDYAISIATIHHFSTKQRRIEAVKELIRIVRPLSKTQVSESTDAGIAQNSAGRFLIYVWALEQKGESRRKFEAIQKEQDESGRDLLVPWVLSSAGQPREAPDEANVYQRYYHVFEEGELELLVKEAASQMPNIDVQIEVTGWEKGNWYGIWKCIERD